MENFKFLDYRANGQNWRFDWALPLPTELWTARCPITNSEISGTNSPTDEQKHYAEFQFCEPRSMKTRIWIQEPLDASDVQPDDKVHYRYVQGDTFKRYWVNQPVAVRINDGDDSYYKKEYTNLSFAEAMRQAQEDVAILLIATSYDELIDTACNSLDFECDN